MRGSIAVVAALLLLFGCTGITGTGGTPTPAAGHSPTPAHTPVAQGTPTLEATGTPGGLESPTPPAGETRLLMLGRSVTENWGNYMGLQYDDARGGLVGEYGGLYVITRHLDSPPTLPDTLDTYMAEEAGNADVVFFKLCFVDFSQTGGEGLADDEGYVEHAYQVIVGQYHKKMIVGNALPMVEQDTTEGLVQNHEAYNAWLDEFAAAHPDVCVLDLYGSLATADGYLNQDYASSPEDSHPNSAGYDVITPLLLEKAGACS